jgi:hypothetical protein
MEITYEEFVERYKPKKNHLDEDASYDGYLFETYGEEIDFVKQQPSENIWTLLDCDGKLILSSGWHYVNRMGYVVTEIPVGKDVEFIEVIDDDDDIDDNDDDLIDP